MQNGFLNTSDIPLSHMATVIKRAKFPLIADQILAFKSPYVSRHATTARMEQKLHAPKLPAVNTIIMDAIIHVLQGNRFKFITPDFQNECKIGTWKTMSLVNYKRR